MSSEQIAHYQVLEKLAAGGMGVVYRARDLNLERPVAVKLLPEELTHDSERRKRLLREARIAASLNHPNICTVYEVGEDRGRIFIAMEFVPGSTLASRLEGGPLPTRELLAIALEIAEGLAEAHAADVIHRDLKPQNVMVTPSGRTKILDFGLAKMVPTVAEDAATSSMLSSAGLVVGTLPYMSPEQVQGGAIDARSDVFSYGVVLYQMVSGRRPFRGDTAPSVAAEILKGDPEALAVICPDLPRELARIVERCLEKRPEDRYRDAREVLTDLRTIRVPALEKPQRRPLRGLPWLVAPLALVAGLLAYVRVPRAPVSRPPATHKQVTFSGHATRPTISPDGRLLAFVDTSSKPRRVVVQETAGGGGITVFEAREVIDLRWAPGGSELVVVSLDPSGTHLVPRLGGNVRTIQEPFGHAAWAANGESLALATYVRGSLVFVRRSGELIREVAMHGDYKWVSGMDWSPSGSYVLLSAANGRGQSALWLVRVADGRETKLLDVGDGSLTDVGWSEREGGFYYLRVKGRTTSLWKSRLGPDGTLADEPQLLETGLQAGDTFSLGGRGRTLAYTRRTQHSTIWLARRKSSEGDVETSALTTGTHEDFHPSVSPDGRQLAFARIAGQESSIFVMPLTGGKPRRLTFQSGLQYGPAWSPDGQEIAFLSTEGDGARVWIVPSGGGTPRRIAGTAATGMVAQYFHPLAWAPGQQIVYQVVGHQNLHILDPADEKTLSLLKASEEEAGWLFQPRYSPDGSTLAVHWNRDKNGIWFVDTRSGDVSPLVEDPGFPLGWSTDGTQIFALHGKEDLSGTRIAIVSLSGGKTPPFMTLPFEAGTGSVMTPDGRLIAVVAAQSSDVWLLEDFDSAVR